MRFQKVFDTLQNSINVKINKAELGRIIGLSRSGVDYNLKNDTLIDDTDVQKIETFYGVRLVRASVVNDSMVTLQPLEASCGNGITIDTSLIDKYDINAQYSIVVAKGTSMTPTINNEDVCVIKKFDGNFIDGIYCFSFESDMYIKRLSKNLNQLICTSDNPEFEKIVLKGDELDKINIYGRVVTVIRKF